MSYTAIVLTDESHRLLLNKFKEAIPSSWEMIAHHVTLHMGSPDREEVIMILQDNSYEFDVIGVAKDDKVIAARVALPASMKSSNKIPHVTIAVNRKAGGKPVMSNNLSNWIMLPNPFKISGTLEEVK
jgi:hypothetical protein